MSLNAFAGLILSLAVLAVAVMTITWEPEYRSDQQPEIVFQAVTVVRRECIDVGREKWCKSQE